MFYDDLFDKDTREKVRKAYESGELNEAGMKQLIVSGMKDNFEAFVKIIFKDHCQGANGFIATPKFHLDMVEMYENSMYVGIAAPRSHAKTTLTSLFYIAWLILYQKAKFIVLISASEDMSVRFLRRLKNELEYNRTLKYFFGNQKSEKWAEREIKTAKDGEWNGTTVVAIGRGAQVRGLIEGTTRPTHIILDDLEDDELVRSSVRRQDLKDWFDGSVLPSKADDGRVIIVGTILHEDSLLNNILDQEKYPEFVTKKFAALKDDGTPLWPERFSQKKLDSIKNAYANRGQTSKFSAEYLNQPLAAEDQIFKRKDFRFYDTLPEDVTHYITVDAAISASKTSDYTVIMDCAWTRDNQCYVVEYVRKRLGAMEIIQEIFKMYDKYYPLYIGIEEMLATKAIKPFLVQEMKKRGVFLPIKYLKAIRGSGAAAQRYMSDGKYQRIVALEPIIQAGNLFMKKNMDELQQELMIFPKGRHDDVIDSLAYQLLVLRPRSKHGKILYTPKFSKSLIS